MQKKRNKQNQTIIFFIVLILVVAFIFMLNGKKEAVVVAAPTPQPQPAPAPEPDPLPTPAPAEVKKQDSFIVFYAASIGTEDNTLPYDVYSDYNLENKINWDGDYYAVFGYFPTSNKAYLVNQVKSDEYVSGSIRAVTKGNKLFLLNNELIDVIDPLKGNKLYTLTTSTKISSFAVVDNSIFYRNSAGELWKLNLDSAEQKKLLDNNDQDNVGTLYGIQERLVTISYDQDINEYIIREHNLDTGKVIKTTNTIPAGNLRFFEGETAFYIVAQDETKQKRYYVYRIELGDTAETLIGMDLDESESAIAGVDEHSGKLFITIDGATPGIADSVVVHDLATKESKEINLDPKIRYTGNPPEYFSLD